MAIVKKKFDEGINIGSTPDAGTEEGEVWVDSNDNKAKVFLDGIEQEFITSNTSAAGISYDNSLSGLNSTNVQDALDEVKDLIDIYNSITPTWTSGNSTGTYSAAGSTVTKTSATNWDLILKSNEEVTLSSRTHSIEYSVPTGTFGALSEVMVGFKSDAINNIDGQFGNKVESIDFGLFYSTDPGLGLEFLIVIENGQEITIGQTIADLDVLRITIDKTGVITYYKNGSLIYTSLTTATGVMGVGMCFYANGASVEDIRLIPH